MSPRQLAFAQEYPLDHNGTAAAIRAGYAQSGAHVEASRLLRNPKVAALIAESERAAAARLGLTRERVLQELQAALEMARQQGSPLAMVAALREAAKICGFYSPERKEIQISAEGWEMQREIEAMSDSELLAIAASADSGPAGASSH